MKTLSQYFLRSEKYLRRAHVVCRTRDPKTGGKSRLMLLIGLLTL